MTAILISIALQCGPHRDGLSWYAYCWMDVTNTPRTVDWPVMYRDCLYGPDVRAPHGCTQRFDFDRDGDVDLQDFTALQGARDVE